MAKRQYLKHFKDKSAFNAKQFDIAYLNTQDYVKENGLAKDELELISNYCLTQNISKFIYFKNYFTFFLFFLLLAKVSYQ